MVGRLVPSKLTPFLLIILANNQVFPPECCGKARMETCVSTR